MGAGLADFWFDDDTAVASLRVFLEVILMFFLSDEKFFQGRDLGNDRIVPDLLRSFLGKLKFLLLAVIGIEHGRSVLRTDVGTLAVQRCWVVHDKKQIENDASWNNRRIKRYADDLGVASRASRNSVVVRPAFTSGIPSFYLRNTLDLTVDRVQAPKTSAAEYKLHHTSSIPPYNEEVNTKDFQELVAEKGAELYRSMPWRDDTRPYYVLVSELMLQQTQVDRVIPKFNEFIARFPDEPALANAPLSEVLVLWNGLGYNRRAKYLHDAAKMITSEFGGNFPVLYEELLRLPGVGPNTAGAIMTYAFNRPEPFIETNVRTVYFHHFFDGGDKVPDATVKELVASTLDQENPREFYWALMDYGTFLKKQGAGRIRQSAHYKKQAALKGSVREIRGQIIRALTTDDKTMDALKQAVTYDQRFDGALAGLIADGLVMETSRRFHLTK